MLLHKIAFSPPTRAQDDRPPPTGREHSLLLNEAHTHTHTLGALRLDRCAHTSRLDVTNIHIVPRAQASPPSLAQVDRLVRATTLKVGGRAVIAIKHHLCVSD